MMGTVPPEQAETVTAASVLEDNLPYIVGGCGGIFLIIVVIIIVIVIRKKMCKKKEQPRTVLFSSEAPSQLDSAQKSLPPTSSDKYESGKEPLPPPSNAQLPRLPPAPTKSWLQRERTEKPQLTADYKIMDNFDEKKWQTKILPKINLYDKEGQVAIFLLCSSLAAYAAGRKNKTPYGYLRQFFELIRHCVATQNDCLATWERIFRFIRLLDAVVKRKAPKDPKCTSLKLCERMRTILVNCARPIFAELGWNIMPNEDPKDTMMRFWAVRVLLWADQSEVQKELIRLASLPFEQLESPIRAVVLLFQTRNQNRGEEMKAMHWSTVMDDPKDEDKFGTVRQHLLFGLAAARDEKKVGTPGEFKVMLETCAALFTPDTTFGTTDTFWAYSGATEYFENAKPLIDLMVKTSQTMDGEEWMRKQIEQLYAGKKGKEALKIIYKHLYPFIDGWDCIAESCSSKKQYKEWTESVGPWESPFNYGDDVPPGHCSTFYEQRGADLDAFLADKKFAHLFDDALKRFEER